MNLLDVRVGDRLRHRDGRWGTVLHNLRDKVPNEDFPWMGWTQGDQRPIVFVKVDGQGVVGWRAPYIIDHATSDLL